MKYIDNGSIKYTNLTLPAWTSNTVYPVGSMVLYNNGTYTCIEEHTSGQTLDNNKWSANSIDLLEIYTKTEVDNLLDDKEDKSNSISWKASTTYSVGDNVAYQNKIYSCVTAHTSTTTFDSTKWQQLVVTEHPVMWDSSNNLIPV